MEPTDFTDFVRGLRRATSEPYPDLPPRPRPRPLPEAQRMELRARWNALNDDSERPSPGDIVEEKQGLSFLVKEARKSTVMILLRALDLDDPIDMLMATDMVRRTAVDRLDCLVAFTDPNGGLATMPHQLARLRRAERQE